MGTDQTSRNAADKPGGIDAPVGDGATDVEAIARRSGSSFFWAMRLLPSERRQAMFALYAFCREVDDIADGAGHLDDKRARLQNWREDIERLFAGRPKHLVALALLDAVSQYALSKDDFLLVIDGMEMDADDSVRIADMDALRDYCDHVACAVGRLSTPIFGLSEDRGAELADALGQALQLTNILRDLDEDARSDRLYLPQSLLLAHGIPGSSPAAALADPRISAVCDEVARLAQRKFEETAVILKLCERRRVRPARLMMESYRRLLVGLMRRGWQRRNERMSLPLIRKLWIIFRYGFL